MENLYKVLNCHETVSVQELKKSYQELALKFHPDKSPGQSSAGKFIKIKQAWNILGDSRLRKQYDVKWKERCLAQTYPIQDTVDFEEFDKVESNEPGDSEIIPCENEDERSDIEGIENEHFSGSMPKVGSGSSEHLTENVRDNLNSMIDNECSIDKMRNENLAGSNMKKIVEGDNSAGFASSDFEEMITVDNHAVCAASNIDKFTNSDSKIDASVDSSAKVVIEGSEGVAGRHPLHGDDEMMYAYSCRCGGSYVLTDVDVKLKFDIVCCDTCSLSVQVIYNDTDDDET